MRLDLTDPLWLDEQLDLPLAALAELSGLSEAELRDLVDCGALMPSVRESTRLSFSGTSVAIARTACRLRDDFELDANALAVSLLLLERIRDLEARCRDLQARAPR